MIGYFPEIYPDELMYSVFVRYHMHTVGFNGVATTKMLTGKALQRINKCFYKFFKGDIEKYVLNALPENDELYLHSLGVYANIFMPNKEFFRDEANSSIVQHLRYCPLCARSDRDKYKEAYWHASHQCSYIKVCHIHNCTLIDTNVHVSGKVTYDHAEFIIPYKYEFQRGDNDDFEFAKLAMSFINNTKPEYNNYYINYLHVKFYERYNEALTASNIGRLNNYHCDENTHLERLLTKQKNLYLSHELFTAYKSLNITYEEFSSFVERAEWYFTNIGCDTVMMRRRIEKAYLDLKTADKVEMVAEDLKRGEIRVSTWNIAIYMGYTPAQIYRLPLTVQTIKALEL